MWPLKGGGGTARASDPFPLVWAFGEDACHFCGGLCRVSVLKDRHGCVVYTTMPQIRCENHFWVSHCGKCIPSHEIMI